MESVNQCNSATSAPTRTLDAVEDAIEKVVAERVKVALADEMQKWQRGDCRLDPFGLTIRAAESVLCSVREYLMYPSKHGPRGIRIPVMAPSPNYSPNYSPYLHVELRLVD